jgi:hypothetical protein
MATDYPRRCAPVDLAPEALLLPGFDGDGADPYLLPVNALVLGGGPRLLVIPGARRAPWTAALAAVADEVRWIVSARPALTPDLRLALARCRHAVPLGGFPAGERLAAGRFALLDPPTAPVRSRAVLDVERRLLYSADAFGAPVLMPATDTDDLDDAYWDQAVRLHAGWAGTDRQRVATLAHLDLELIVPAFGPILRGARLAAVLADSPPSSAESPPSATSATYAARMEGLVSTGC